MSRIFLILLFIEIKISIFISSAGKQKMKMLWIKKKMYISEITMTD